LTALAVRKILTSVTTILTVKGTTTIPLPLRKRAGLQPGCEIEWDYQGGKLTARKVEGRRNALQASIQRMAGSWKGAISGKDLLKRTRS
jgi:bifunctional DNA-binding transcriptional regulator/antitoxin component of YhaV-PrlF toxin-antitoxin module